MTKRCVALAYKYRKTNIIFPVLQFFCPLSWISNCKIRRILYAEILYLYISWSEGAMNRENNESNERTRAKCLTRRARRQPRSRSLLFGGRVICLPRIIDESGRNARVFARAKRKKRESERARQREAAAQK